MDALDFREIAELLNHSRTTQFDFPPVRGKDNGWVLYQGHHKVHTSVYPFHVLYLHARANRADIEDAERQIEPRVETHVVYPPSLRVRQPSLLESFRRATAIWSTWEYLRSFIKDELQTYVKRVSGAPPQYYIDPPVETPSHFTRKFPNPLLSFLLDRSAGSGIPEGALGILLAEPGQGKTYMSRYLVSEIARRKFVPLFIDSSQWHTMPVEDHKSIWKTIVHSFRHHDAPIGWLEGHENAFLRATLKADSFRIIFDGFDEYILQNKGSVQPVDVLESLAALASDTGARIIITSRTSFWDTNIAEEDTSNFLTRSGSFVYKILPFRREDAENYFKRRFESDAAAVGKAVRLYGRLYEDNKELVGRGFVLSLVADLIDRMGNSDVEIGTTRSGLLWLMQALCEREELRQKLPFTASQQLEFLRTFAAEGAVGEEMGSDLLDLAMHIVRPDMDVPARKACIEKLKSHPLIAFDPATGSWGFKQAQIGNVLLADQLVKWPSDALVNFVDRARLEAGQRHDLSAMIIGLVRSNYSQEDAIHKIGNIIQTTLQSTQSVNPAVERGKLAATLALMAVEEFKPRGHSHEERTALLLRMLGGAPVHTLYFSGTLASFDFRGIVFEQCSFDRVTWATCTFDELSTFKRCAFTNGGSAPKSSGLGSATLTECILDEEARALFNTVRVNEGKRKYTLEDAKADIHWVISKFIIKGGIGLKTVEERSLLKGPISTSRYKKEVLEALQSTVIEEHTISGPTARGYHVREEAAEAVRFYSTNNVLTGPLREAIDRLARKLSLPSDNRG